MLIAPFSASHPIELCLAASASANLATAAASSAIFWRPAAWASSSPTQARVPSRAAKPLLETSRRSRFQIDISSPFIELEWTRRPCREATTSERAECARLQHCAGAFVNRTSRAHKGRAVGATSSWAPRPRASFFAPAPAPLFLAAGAVRQESRPAKFKIKIRQARGRSRWRPSARGKFNYDYELIVVIARPS